MCGPDLGFCRWQEESTSTISCCLFMSAPLDCQQAEELTVLLLSDSSLPVGGFVSSSGLESFVSHGFLAHCNTDLTRSEAILNFAFSNAQSYANLSAAFFYHLHALLRDALAASKSPSNLSSPERVDVSIQEDQAQRIALVIRKLNQLFDSMCLSPVNRRNSYAQGAAFLLLYTKSFAPSSHAQLHLPATGPASLKSRLINALKREIRRGNWSIHYPISFAFVTSLLELPFDRAIHLHIFLHIRSILSAGVRLNIIGPYLCQRIMFTNMKPMLEEIGQEIKGKRLARSDLIEAGLLDPATASSSDAVEEVEKGPATTWPFGEIIQTRHDNCHVRLFNS